MLRFVVPLLAVSSALSLAPVSAWAAEAGQPLRRDFTPRDYEEHNQNWCAVQDRSGALYVGNRNVVLRHDGVRWQAIATGGIFIRGLAVDAADRVWVGGVNEVGYLDDDGRGSRAYTSLRDRLPEAERDFRDIRRVFATSHGIYFVADDRILRWHGETFTVERTGRVMASQVGDELVVSVAGGPALRAWRGGSGRDVCAAPEVTDVPVPFVAARAAGGWWVGTLRRGLFVLENGRLEPFATEADAALRDGLIYHGRALSDGSLALALRQGGLLIVGPDGKLRHHLHGDNGGLPSNMVLGTYEDHDGGLWALLNTGLSRLRWPSPITTFGAAQGLRHELLTALHRHAGRLYVGTGDGLFVLEPGDPTPNPPRPARFAPAGGVTRRVWQMRSAGDTLLIATETGLLALPPGADRAEPLPQPADARYTTAVHVPRNDPDRAYAGGARGIQMFRREAGQWRFEGVVPGLDVEARSFVEARDGSLWIGTIAAGFVRIVGLPGGGEGRPLRVERYRLGEHGLEPPSARSTSHTEPLDGDVAFFTGTRIFRFDPAVGRFVEAAASRHRPPGPGVSLVSANGNRSDFLWVRSFDPAPGAGPWKGRKLWRVPADGAWENLPHRVSEFVGEAPIFLEEHDGPGPVVWIGGSSGLVRAELPAALFQPRPFTARISRVTDLHGAVRRLAGAAPLEVAPGDNSFLFALASSRFDATEQLFQTRLEGRDDEWTPFSPTPTATYTGLAPGSYLLQARARDADGQVSAPASYAFVIRPPWWESPWMLGLYALGTVGGLFAVVQWRLAQVRRRNEKLEALVAQRTADLRASEQQLRLARDGAEAANRAKSAFLANMSHELRTPLNAVLGYAQVVLRDPALPGDHQRRVRAIAQGGEHLLQMINEVLDLAKIEAEKVELDPRPVSLSRLLSALCEMFHLRGAQKGIAFGFRELAPLPEAVLADEGRLRQVLINLLENAVKFTAPGGRIDLEVGRDGDRFQFSVSDTGAGIAAAELARLFQPFQQAGGAAMRQQGAGLGLAISQRLVGLMGGVIAVESAPGRGSRFHFAIVLPVTAARRESADPFAPRVQGYRGPRRRVLVVDDEPVNRQVLREMLEPLGFVVTEAADGEEAVRAAAAHAPDAVLMDLRMPRLDGLAATRRLRAEPALAATRIVAVSASVFAADKDEALRQGCDDFLPKPFRERELVAVLGRVLALEWMIADPPSAPLAAGGDALPDPDTLQALAMLAAGGDVVGLRARLATLRASAPACAAFVDELDRLAAEFQMGRISRVIADAQTASA
ncbi:MAG TPA: ATP-binding protein [Opitutaceae bacterium]|nr:ATP-binding protein [Opitutaceae bacterium]